MNDNDWIRYSEVSQPLPNSRILVTDGEVQTCAYFNTASDGHIIWVFDGGLNDLQVSHWMPLPKPPQRVNLVSSLSAVAA